MTKIALCFDLSYNASDTMISMKSTLPVPKALAILLATASLVLLPLPSLLAYQASQIPTARLINADELLKILKSPNGEKPLLIQVGSHVLFSQAHIPGSEYIGPASSEAGLQQLRKRLSSVARSKSIVLYCGCCPWNHCPNVKPADDLLHELGFTNAKVLYIPNNLGADWVDKGYPVTKGD